MAKYAVAASIILVRGLGCARGIAFLKTGGPEMPRMMNKPVPVDAHYHS